MDQSVLCWGFSHDVMLMWTQVTTSGLVCGIDATAGTTEGIEDVVHPHPKVADCSIFDFLGCLCHISIHCIASGVQPQRRNYLGYRYLVARLTFANLPRLHSQR